MTITSLALIAAARMRTSTEPAGMDVGLGTSVFKYRFSSEEASRQDLAAEGRICHAEGIFASLQVIYGDEGLVA